MDGILDLIPSAKVGHIGLYRDPETHQPVEYYCKMPSDISERDVIVLDPMLATGGSASAAITFIKGYGCKHIKLMNVLAAPEGIQVIRRDHPDVDIYVAGVDEKLNEHAYIVPGLGDAKRPHLRHQISGGSGQIPSIQHPRRSQIAGDVSFLPRHLRASPDIER